MKEALWSFHFYGAELEPSRVPADLRPIPLTSSMQSGAAWDDEHACDRRLRSLRRLNRDFLAGVEDDNETKVLLNDPEAARARIVSRLGEDRVREYGRVFRTDLNVTRNYVAQVRSEVERTDGSKCIPMVSDPGFDPKRGRPFVFSRLLVRRPLDDELVCLLDPRWWDKCSDLFDDTYRVEQVNGGYLPIDPEPIPPGNPWQGLLYEKAGVGPQTVENVLRVRFAPMRSCSDRPKRTAACRVGACAHQITNVDVDYGLYDSLSYRLGGIDLPGLMRQNYGVFRAKRNRDGTTEISCSKTIRFGRVTDWGIGAGAFDYGEILNYMAPTYLSLWIYDVTQVVPCYKWVEKTNKGIGA